VLTIGKEGTINLPTSVPSSVMWAVLGLALIGGTLLLYVFLRPRR
jgi:hypothetical protein